MLSSSIPVVDILPTGNSIKHIIENLSRYRVEVLVCMNQSLVSSQLLIRIMQLDTGRDPGGG